MTARGRSARAGAEWALVAALVLSLAGHVACGRDAEAGKVLLQPGVFSDARCLDGTPGAFYVNRNPKNDTWIIYLNGGGECFDAQSCQYRATTALGSSSLMPDNIWFNVSRPPPSPLAPTHPPPEPSPALLSWLCIC